MTLTSQKPMLRPARKPGRTLAAVAVCALVWCSFPAEAQGVSGSSTSGTGTMANKMLPTVREHLKMAQEGVAAVSNKK